MMVVMGNPTNKPYMNLITKLESLIEKEDFKSVNNSNYSFSGDEVEGTFTTKNYIIIYERWRPECIEDYYKDPKSDDEDEITEAEMSALDSAYHGYLRELKTHIRKDVIHEEWYYPEGEVYGYSIVVFKK